MAIVEAKIQTVEDIYRLVWTAIASKQPIGGIYKDRPRMFCPHRLGRNRAKQLRVLCYQYGGDSESGLAHPKTGGVSPWRNCDRSNCWKVPGRPRPTIPVRQVVSSTPISMQKISRNRRHSKDSEELWQAGIGQWRCAGTLWNGDYAARDEPGEPRGRKSGGSSGAGNPRLTERAEGEKRFRRNRVGFVQSMGYHVNQRPVIP
jgi:hypothetical protein